MFRTLSEALDHNRRTQEPYLDLGRLGLVGDEPELAQLQDFTWLNTLVFSNEWIEFDLNTKEWVDYQSQNIGKVNHIAYLPICPTQIKTLIIEGGWDKRFEITDIAYLKNLLYLEYLDISYNNIQDIIPLKELKHLIYLHLGENNIQDIIPFKNLINLTYLRIWSNNIQDIEPLNNLPNLIHLDIDKNKVQKVSLNFLNNLPNLKELYLLGNPIQNIPQEIFNKSGNIFFQVRDYLESVAKEEEQRELNEAKLMMVGVGEVGKSEITEALSETTYQFVGNRPVTQGIHIKTWTMPCVRAGKEEKNTDFKAHIWDFAGQEINYGTHQFFLTKNSVYVFLWDMRKGEVESKFDYWLGVVSLLSEASPVFVVQNKIDLREGELQQREWKERFPNIVGFYKTSCLTGAGIVRLREDIQASLLALPNTREIWNKHRYAIRETLEQKVEEYMSYREYVQLCEANTLNREQAGFLAKQLHDLGVILHFADDIRLNQTVVLKTSWAIEAAYLLIDTKKVHIGRFEKHDLATIWADERFEEKHDFLLNLMQRFELIFQFQESDTYIVPEGLPVEPPVLPDSLSHSLTTSLRFEYHYIFLPKGILNRLTCRLHHLIAGEAFWRYGVALEYEAHTHALITMNEVVKILRVEVWGKSADKLLAIIRSNIEAIHTSLKNPALEEMIPCYCEKCKETDTKTAFFEYNHLRNCLEEGDIDIRCKNKTKVLIKQLLEGIEESRNFRQDFSKEVGKALAYLEKANLQGYFEEMDKVDMEFSHNATYASLKKKFIADKESEDFKERLAVFAQGFLQ